MALAVDVVDGRRPRKRAKTFCNRMVSIEVMLSRSWMNELEFEKIKAEMRMINGLNRKSRLNDVEWVRVMEYGNV
jgi:hypothetical protein